ITTLKANLTHLEKMCLELANWHDPADIEMRRMKEIGLKKELNLKDLAHLFLQADAAGFAKANPYLKSKELNEALAHAQGEAAADGYAIKYLYNLVGLYMATHVHKATLERSVELCEEIEKCDKNVAKADSLAQKLADELKPLEKPAYQYDAHPEF